jgi:hypothetical protein
LPRYAAGPSEPKEVFVKGESSFQERVAAEIRSLLHSKERAARDNQKHLRAELRKKYRFYISDFPGTHRPFRAKDFDQLVAEGRVKVTR